jgi:hypothetical protein
VIHDHYGKITESFLFVELVFDPLPILVGCLTGIDDGVKSHVLPNFT